jgi:DNA excision repair protein ERCC-2
MSLEPKPVVVALRDFALPAPRTGDIEFLSVHGRAAVEGRVIHARVQARRAKVHAGYEAEVRVSRSFDRGGYRFRVDGRMDGVFRSKTVRIEEIKTAFNIKALGDELSRAPMLHPYGLQLLTYGYFFWLENGVVPGLSFHLVSTRSRDSLDLVLDLDTPRYEQWLDIRLDELVAEATKAEKRAKRRRRTAAAFAFPYDFPRPGQSELMQTVGQGIAEGLPMLIQAPTGLGKTAAVLLPVLRDAMARGQRVFYVTPKNSQHAVAEDAASRFTQAGSKVRTLTITAKAKLCPKGEPLCSASFCEYAEGYHTKVREQGLLDLVAKKRKLTARTFNDLGQTYEVCPFELQLESAAEADMVICDYNYVFAPRSAFGRMTELSVNQEGNPDLVIDEAHNLPSRAMEYYSPSLSTADLEQMRLLIPAIDERFRTEMEQLLDGCIRTITACSPPECRGPVRIDPPLEQFTDQDERLRTFLSHYLASDVEITPGDPVLRLCLSWSVFTEALELAIEQEQGPFITTFSPMPDGAVIRIICCDASDMLRDCYDGYEQVVGFSATLKPFEYYARMCGLDPASVRTAEFGSPFPKENRKILVIPQISTKYADRDRNYAKIADAMSRIAGLRHGNYFAFFPSFEFLERTLALFQPPDGFSILKQDRDTNLSRVGEILGQLREGSGQILFCVQGGVFSEGVDYPGDMAIGAFVIGPPLPTVTPEREEMRAYYHRQYGAGFDYAYAIPAMAKAVQAAGRVIRSETDRGLIVLMDSRFVLPAYSRSLPRDWFASNVNELVSDAILRDVRAFWEQ